MKSGTMFERGELVLIPHPFTDLSARKRRPVLILTNPDQHGDFIALQELICSEQNRKGIS